MPCAHGAGIGFFGGYLFVAVHISLCDYWLHRCDSACDSAAELAAACNCRSGWWLGDACAPVFGNGARVPTDSLVCCVNVKVSAAHSGEVVGCGVGADCCRAWVVRYVQPGRNRQFLENRLGGIQ